MTIFVSSDVVKIISVVLLFIIAIMFISKGFTYAKLKKLAEKDYQEITDEIFDIIKNLNFVYKKSFDDIKYIKEYSQLDSLLKPLTDCIADLSKIIISDKSSICIKVIETPKLMNNDFTEWKIRTIARSRTTKANRQRKDKQSVLVSNNSDFETIIKGDDPTYEDGFVVPNLNRLISVWKETGREYKNSTKNYLNIPLLKNTKTAQVEHFHRQK